MWLSHAPNDGFLKCLVSGAFPRLGMAPTGHPPRDSMAAKRMTVGRVALLTSANLCSHLFSDLTFATCVVAVTKVWI